MRRITRSFDGTKVFYDVSKSKGSKICLVFLHGLGGDLTAWKTERSFFRKRGISTIAVDLRGHGKSGRPNLASDYKLDFFARDVFEVIKKEKVDEFILIGHCFGGMVACVFHKLYPGQAKAYVLVDSSYKAPEQLSSFVKHHPMFEHLINLMLESRTLTRKQYGHVDFARFKGSRDYDLRRIISDINHTSLKSWIFTYENMAEFNAIKILKSIKTSVLIIEGEKDSVFDMLKAKKMHNLIRNSSLKAIPEANHILVINNPRAVEESIYDFIKSRGFLDRKTL